MPGLVVLDSQSAVGSYTLHGTGTRQQRWEVLRVKAAEEHGLLCLYITQAGM